MDADYTMKTLLNKILNRYKSLSKVKRATLWITLSGFMFSLHVFSQVKVDSWGWYRFSVPFSLGCKG